jgi:hypothetical protein
MAIVHFYLYLLAAYCTFVPPGTPRLIREATIKQQIFILSKVGHDYNRIVPASGRHKYDLFNSKMGATWRRSGS